MNTSAKTSAKTSVKTRANTSLKAAAPAQSEEGLRMGQARQWRFFHRQIGQGGEQA